MGTSPSYLRIVATTRCNYRCGYCHMEGDPHLRGTLSELPLDDLRRCVQVAASVGVKKFKFLGGEPLLRRDLPSVIEAVRGAEPEGDISLITAGVVPVERLMDAYEGGLDRVNVSVHGFGERAMGERISVRGAYQQRAEFIAAALREAERRGVPIKLNYVWRGHDDNDDLAALLDWAAPRPVLVNVLDDLSRDLSWSDLAAVLTALRGVSATVRRVDDLHSLPTQHWVWSDGLRVELKDHRLGDVAPFDACGRCPERARCKEGILALRLTHQGMLMPCMDRPDLGFPLAEWARANGVGLAASMWRRWVEAL